MVLCYGIIFQHVTGIDNFNIFKTVLNLLQDLVYCSLDETLYFYYYMSYLMRAQGVISIFNFYHTYLLLSQKFNNIMFLRHFFQKMLWEAGFLFFQTCKMLEKQCILIISGNSNFYYVQ